MGKYLLGTVFILFGTIINSHAQITITQADFPSIGDGLVKEYDTLVPGGTTVGGTGSQTWDFSTLVMDYSDTTLYVDPSTTLNGSVFPDATIATSDDEFSAYIKADSSAVMLIGIVAGFAGSSNATSVKFSPPQKFFEFPATIGTSYLDTSAFNAALSGSEFSPFIDSVGIRRSSFLSSTIDAYGMVTTPSGTYDAIRQYVMEITYDSIMMKFPGVEIWLLIDTAQLGFANPIIDTTYNYQWYALGEGSPVIEIETDGPAGNVLEASWKVDVPLIAAVLTSSDVACFGGCDGSATASTFNGVLPFSYLWSDGNAQTNATATNLCTGTYSVVITDAASNTSTASITIDTPTDLALITTVNNPSCDSCSDGSASTSAGGGVSPYVYLWNDPASQTTTTASNLMNGTYVVVTVTDANGCMVMSDSMSVVGIESYRITSGVDIYPNPTSGLIYFDRDQRNSKVTVIDMLGKKVLFAEPEENGSVDLSALPDGTYHVQAWDGVILRSKQVVLIR